METGRQMSYVEGGRSYVVHYEPWYRNPLVIAAWKFFLRISALLAVAFFVMGFLVARSIYLHH